MGYRNIIKDSSLSAASAGITALLSALQAIIVARMLGPVLYGTLQVYRLILTYTTFTDLGTFWAMVREMSFHRGRGELERVEEIRNGTFTINVITSVLTCIVVILVFLFFPQAYPTTLTEMLTIAFIIIAQCVFIFFRNYFVAVKQFVTRSVLIVLFSVCNILFVLLLGHFYGLIGVLLAMLLAYVVSIFFGIFKSAFQVHFFLTKRLAFDLIKTGAPLCVNGLLAILVASVDRLMIMYFLPVIQLGYYGIAAMIKTFMETLYRTAFMAIFPDLIEAYGKTNDLDAIRNYVWKPLVISAHLSPLFFGAVIILIAPMIEYILPQYIPGVLATQLIIASSFFGCLQVGVVNFFVTINNVQKIYPLRIAAVVFCAAATWIAIAGGWGIEGVAFCFLLSSAFLAGLMILSFQRHYAISLSAALKSHAELYYPFGYMCLGLWITRFVSFSSGSPILADLLSTLLKLAVFMVSNILLLVVIQKKTGILTEIFNVLVYFFKIKILRKRLAPAPGANVRGS